MYMCLYILMFIYHLDPWCSGIDFLNDFDYR